MTLYLQLFWSFFQIGLFSFGGGYAALPLIQAQVVDVHHWLTLSELTDLVTISQMTPGPIAINAATFVGIQLGGPLGAVVCTLGCVLPSCLVVSLLAWVYFRWRELTALRGALNGLRPAIVALIAGAGLSLLIHALWGEEGLRAVPPDLPALGLFVVAFVVLRKCKPDPVFVMLGCGVIGVALKLLFPG